MSFNTSLFYLLNELNQKIKDANSPTHDRQVESKVDKF